MKEFSRGRRDFLRQLTACGVAGLPALAATAEAASRYDPAAAFEIIVSEVEFRRTHSELEWSDYSLTGRDRMLGARMVAPSGFPMFRAWEISSCDTRGSSSTEEA